MASCNGYKTKHHHCQSGTKIIDERKTAILEILDTTRSEYELEIRKKTSFETMVGVIFVLLGTVLIFSFDKIQPSCLIRSTCYLLSFITLIKLISGFLVYTTLFLAVYYLLKVITFEQPDCFVVNSIDEQFIVHERIDMLVRIVFTYRDIIIQDREINQKRNRTFQRAIGCVVAMLLSIVVFISL